MREFKAPELSIIRLANDDLVTEPSSCNQYECSGLVCPECAECGGQDVFTCIAAFICGHYTYRH